MKIRFPDIDFKKIRGDFQKYGDEINKLESYKLYKRYDELESKYWNLKYSFATLSFCIWMFITFISSFFVYEIGIKIWFCAVIGIFSILLVAWLIIYFKSNKFYEEKSKYRDELEKIIEDLPLFNFYVSNTWGFPKFEFTGDNIRALEKIVNYMKDGSDFSILDYTIKDHKLTIGVAVNEYIVDKVIFHCDLDEFRKVTNETGVLDLSGLDYSGKMFDL